MIVVVALGATGVKLARLVAPPGEAPGYSGVRPELADSGYVSVTHSVHVNASPSQVWAAGNDPSLSLEDIVQFDGGFPAVATSQP